MWKTKHFKSKAEAMKWIEARSIQWQQIFVNNKPYSIEYRKLVKPRNPR